MKVKVKVKVKIRVKIKVKWWSPLLLLVVLHSSLLPSLFCGGVALPSSFFCVVLLSPPDFICIVFFRISCFNFKKTATKTLARSSLIGHFGGQPRSVCSWMVLFLSLQSVQWAVVLFFLALVDAVFVFLLKSNETYEDNYNYNDDDDDDDEGKDNHNYNCNFLFQKYFQYLLFCSSCLFFIENRFSNLSFFFLFLFFFFLL